MKFFKNMLNNGCIVHEILLLPYEYHWTCISCGYNVTKRKKNELTKIQRKKLNFVNRLNYADKGHYALA